MTGAAGRPFEIGYVGICHSDIHTVRGELCERRPDGTVTQGCYSTHIVVDEDFVLKVPESIPHHAATPPPAVGNGLTLAVPSPGFRPAAAILSRSNCTRRTPPER